QHEIASERREGQVDSRAHRDEQPAIEARSDKTGRPTLHLCPGMLRIVVVRVPVVHCLLTVEEEVSVATHGLHQARLALMVADLLPQMRKVNVNGPLTDDRVAPPGELPKELSRQNSTSALVERHQKVKLERRELNELSVYLDLTRLFRELDVP